MKALYRVDSVLIFNADVDLSRLTPKELEHIATGFWGIYEVPENMTVTELRHNKIVDGYLVLLPETEWPDYMPPEAK